MSRPLLPIVQISTFDMCLRLARSGWDGTRQEKLSLVLSRAIYHRLMLKFSLRIRSFSMRRSILSVSRPSGPPIKRRISCSSWLSREKPKVSNKRRKIPSSACLLPSCGSL
jgi:hypothetical protein